MAGAGYKLFQTGSVLTAADVNTYLNEQSVMRFANSAARTSALSSVLAEGMVSYLQDTNAVEVYDGSNWVSIGSSGDITGVTAGTGISGGGTSGTVTITNSMATEITAAGDIIVGTGSGTFDNLPIGTTGQVLTADTTVSPYKVKWASASAGGYTSLASGTLSSSALSISSISSDYRDLVLILRNFQQSSNYDVILQVNSDTASNYSWLVSGNKSSVMTDALNCNSTAIVVNSSNFKASTSSQVMIRFFDYASTVPTKMGMFTSFGFDSAANLKFANYGTFGWNSTSAISSIQSTASFASGTYVLYGVK